jgi:peptidoglycan/LPS O-acetylase OafA/YrhL
VAAVVAYHLHPGVLPGGFLGVDAFFVLSGFLIASLLIAEIDATGRVGLRAFYLRRIRRLMPAVLLVLTALAVYAAVWAAPAELARLRSHGLWSLAWLANWGLLVDGTSYTDLVVGASPLRHMWSLAIEEQFYLVFPLLMVVAAGLVARRHGTTALRWTVGVTALVGAGISAVLMALVAGAGNGIDRAYFGTDTRAQAILVGVVLAAVLVGRPAVGGRGARLAGLAAIPATLALLVLLLVAGEREAWMYQGGFTLAAVCVAAVIAALGNSRWLSRPLSWRPLVGLGLISYGVYLWHWPVMVVLDEQRTGQSGLTLTAVRLAVTFGAAYVSWRLVEQPIRLGRLGQMAGRWSLSAAPTGVGIVVMSLLVATVPSTSVSHTGGFASPLGDAVAIAEEPLASSDDSDAVAAPMSVVMVGDSVAHSLAGAGVFEFPNFEAWRPELSPFDPAKVSLWAVTRPGCSFLPGRVIRGRDARSPGAELSWFCGEWRSDLVAAVDALDADVVVVNLANDVRDRRIGDDFVPLGSPAWSVAFDALLDEMLAIARRTDADLVLLTPAPLVGALVVAGDEGGWREAVMADAMRSFARRRSGVQVLELGEGVCPAGNCGDRAAGFDPAWRYDGLHYGPDGQTWFASWITPLLSPMATTG